MVELLSFRIKNYKSIQDSGICYLDKKVTVLAGKNEAGKTAILEALEDFSFSKPIRQEAIPLSDDNLKPEIEVSLKIEKEIIRIDKDEVSGNDEMILNVSKSYPNTYTVSNGSTSGDSIGIVDNIIKKLNDQKAIEAFLKPIIPNFILFKTFEDILPNQTPIPQAQNNQLIQDLSALTGLKFDIVQPTTDPRKREKHKQEINLKFSKEYKQFWSQDDSHLYVSWDSNNIYFWIKEGEEFYRPEIRSKGRQWHLSFYIRMTARSLENKVNILLIDEPGMFLHATAQKDILRKLEECAERHQIIYSTHSPYLIERNKLGRIRLILKKETGTVIEKITAKADKETLSPILTAIGEDLTTGIRVDRKDSIVLEGYSDYLWLSSFRKLLNISGEFDFVPVVGADAEVHVGGILFGWGLNPIFILDNDKKGADVRKKLMTELAIEDGRILFVSDKKDTEIEDLIADEDKKKHLVSGKTESKVLSATQFYNKIENGEIMATDISEATKNNFEAIFNKLKSVLRS
jgi:predicted ATP-dependent endonuclease of OLD family